MLWTIFLVLLVLWLVELTYWIPRGCLRTSIYCWISVALVVLVIQLIGGRRAI